MRTTIFLFLISVLVILSCEKVKYENTGTIIGPDLADCVCCGGYFIEIEGTRYRFEKGNLPGSFTFNEDQLPLQVELNWELKIDSCGTFNWIEISEITRKGN